MINKKNSTVAKKTEETKGTAKTTNAVNKKTQIKKVTELDEIKRELEKLKQENESLKKGKLKLSFADAEKLYKRKSNLIFHLSKYNDLIQFFEKCNIVDDNSDILIAQNLKLIFESRGEYDRWEEVLKTSNKLVLNEFIPFIIEKLKTKIKELTEEVETINI